jgi:Pretoxin HINT domain
VSAELVEFVLHAVTGEIQTVKATPNHPFWIEGIGWTTADKVQVGDKFNGVHGESLTVSQVTRHEFEDSIDVYNFEVDHFHTYYVSGDHLASGIWVHNANCFSSMRPPRAQVPGKYTGGRHGQTRYPTNDGLDSHHMPANSVNGYGSDNSGPAIKMEPGDHLRTGSHSHVRGSDQYRREQQLMISEGRFGAAIQKYIDDIMTKFPDGKYSSAIWDMLETLEPHEMVGLRMPPL